MRRAPAVLAALALLGVAAIPATGALAPASLLDAVCADGPTDAASLVTDLETEAPTRTTAAGLSIAVVIDPLVPPGIPTALLDTPAGLCTVDSFNLTTAAALGAPTEVASAFASVAAMPWLGDVEVHDLAVDGDTVTLATVGGRHGVTSRWAVTVDALGVRDATFTTTAFGQDLDHSDAHTLEGITSLPGHSRSWTRDTDGMLRIDRTIADDLAASVAEREAAAENAARAAGLAPGDLLEGELDGQVVRYTLGYAAPTVEYPPSGQDLADRLLYIDAGMDRIFDQYEAWGATDVWGGSARTFFGIGTVPDEVGYVNFDSPIAAFCLACAFVGDFIEIHQLLTFGEIIESPAFGNDYPDDNSLALEVVGHEFTHAVQGGYGDGNVGLTNAFYEATAVASQALFHEAENSNQTGSLEYGDNANGCEGFENGRGGWIAAQAAGPFLDGHTYDACWFWWTYVAEHGGDGLVDLMESLPGVRGQGEAQIDRHLLQLDLAAQLRGDNDGTIDLARWAAAYTAGADADGYVIEDGSGDLLDWFTPMQPAERARDLGAGTSVSLTVEDGGTAGFRVTSDGTLLDLPAGAEAFAFAIVDGSLSLVGPVTVGDPLTAGQLLAVVAGSPGASTGSVTLG